MAAKVTTAKPAGGRWLRIVLAVLLAVAVVGLIVWGIAGILDSKPGKAKKPPKISLLPDKPPPPPPPPKEEKKPEPKDQQKEMKAEPPKEPMPQAQNEPLKMEGAAGDGPSAFAAGSVGKEYTGGSVGGKLFQGVFVDRLQRHLQEELNRNRKLRQSDYRVNLRVWLRGDGSVRRAELVQSTGNPAIDELLEQTLLQVAGMREAPPENMPQPIRIRVTARGSG
jgi:protein TonB